MPAICNIILPDGTEVTVPPNADGTCPVGSGKDIIVPPNPEPFPDDECIPVDCVPDPAEFEKCFKYVAACICDTQKAQIEPITNCCCESQIDIVSIQQEIFEFITNTIYEFNQWIYEIHNDLVLTIATYYTQIQEEINNITSNLTNIGGNTYNYYEGSNPPPAQEIVINVPPCPSPSPVKPPEQPECDKPNEIEYLETACGALFVNDMLDRSGISSTVANQISDCHSFVIQSLGNIFGPLSEE